MADKEVPVRRIPEGVSGRPAASEKGTLRPVKPDPDFKGYGSGTKWIEPRFPEYRHGGAVRKVGSPKVSAPCKDSKTIKCY